MSTGGSRGIRTSQDYVRKAGAAARMMLLQAAADQWKVPVGEVSVANGVITHAASKRTTSYGKVAAAAAKLTAPDPKEIKLKDPKTWTIAGKPLKRLDTADKLNGSKLYAIDVKLPGMLNAAIKDAPVFGAKVVSFDDAKVAKMPGVKKVMKVKDTAVAVVADTWWRAKTALDALPITWDEGENGKVSNASIAKHLEEGLNAAENNGERKNGDALAAIAGAAKKIEATYSTPFLSHACMEMMNATVRLSADKAECWVPTQSLEASLAALSEESGLPLAKCEVHRHDLGGGFGRRGGLQDYTRQATAIAKEFPGTPIKLIWSREEDQAHDFYGSGQTHEHGGRPPPRHRTSPTHGSARACAWRPCARSAVRRSPRVRRGVGRLRIGDVIRSDERHGAAAGMSLMAGRCGSSRAPRRRNRGQPSPMAPATVPC